jgi:hypothetical protein
MKKGWRLKETPGISLRSKLVLCEARGRAILERVAEKDS